MKASSKQIIEAAKRELDKEKTGERLVQAKNIMRQIEVVKEALKDLEAQLEAI